MHKEVSCFVFPGAHYINMPPIPGVQYAEVTPGASLTKGSPRAHFCHAPAKILNRDFNKVWLEVCTKRKNEVFAQMLAVCRTPPAVRKYKSRILYESYTHLVLGKSEVCMKYNGCSCSARETTRRTITSICRVSNLSTSTSHGHPVPHSDARLPSYQRVELGALEQ